MRKWIKVLLALAAVAAALTAVLAKLHLDRERKKELDAKLDAVDERFALKKEKLQIQIKGMEEILDRIRKELRLLEVAM